MKIPESQADREVLYRKLVNDCFASRQERMSRYNILRNWFLFGQAEVQEAVEYNKLFSHIDLLSSFLFSGETTSFVIQVPNTADMDYKFEIEKAVILTPKVNETWHDSNMDLTFNDALTWALVFDTTLIKYIPIGKGQHMSYIIPPYSFGVLREDIPTLAHQEAMAHEFFMSESELRRKIASYGKEEQDRILSYLKPKEQTDETQAVPGAVHNIIVASQNVDTGEATGSLATTALINHNYEPTVTEDGVMCYELHVYDDDLKDYRVVTMLEGETILFDAQANTFVPGEVPFVKVTPNPIYNYFWGRTELKYLIPLQEWINKRIPEIKSILAKLADPPRSGWGVVEEKMKALHSAGGIAAFSDPASMGKIQDHVPQEVTDLFREMNVIEQMYNEISGIKEIMKGGSEQGVRAKGHADLLARLGSTRAKKKASILEDAVEKCATLILKCVRKYDDTYFATEKGTKFIAKQLHESAEVKVDSHSSSPIFIEQQIEMATLLFDRKAIDEEDLIDAVRYQNAGYIKVKLRKRKEEEKLAAAAEAKAEEAKSKAKDN